MDRAARDLLVVVDMQNDFISGALGTGEAQAILPRVVEKVRGFSGSILFTRDTHDADYLDSQEGGMLPVPHCIKGTWGWQIENSLEALRTAPALDKGSFGSLELGDSLRALNAEAPITSVTLVGLCTDICVISNALIAKAALPEARVIVDAACCAGATPEGHRTALDALKACQVLVVNAGEA